MVSGDTTCVEYSGTNLMQSFDSEVYLDEDTGEKNVRITFSNGDKCPFAVAENYAYTIDVKCNPEAVEPIAFGIVMENECHPKLLYESAAGCPIVNLGSWAVWLGEHPIITAIILILVGAFTCFKGKKFFDVVVGIFGFMVGFGGAMLIFSSFGMVDYLDPFTVEGSIGMVILAFVLSILVGGILGAILYFFAISVGLYFLASVVGVFLGVMVYNTFFNFLFNIWVFVILVLAGVILMIVLTFLLKDFILIVVTASLGSYICVRGVSLIIGGYPSEMEMFQAYSNGIPLDFEMTFYIYLAGMALLFLLGYCFQNKEKNDEEENKDGYQKLDG